jgi:hypothetical protein
MPSCPRSCFALALALGLFAGTPAAGQVIGFDRDDVSAPLGARGIVAADLNGDGWADLAVAATQPASLAVLLNRGAAGGFVLARTVSLTGGPFDIASADFDRDGRPDLAIANADGNAVDILLTGTVTATTWNHRGVASYFAANGPRGLTLADLNGDGPVDIAFTSFYGNSVTVLYGNGDGTFSSRSLPPSTVGARPQGIAAADFNRDGRQDLVVANTASRILTVLYGTGTPGAFTRRDVASPYQLNVVTATDLTGDGWPDAAAASSGSNAFAVFTGGASGFSLSSSGAVGTSPRGIAFADVNADGRLDLLTANRGASAAAVLLQQPGGVFVVSDEVPSGTNARAVAAADFNRDGRMDFATGNEGAAFVSVFRNSPGLERAAFGFSRQPLLAPDHWLGGGLVVTDLNHNGIPDMVAGATVTLDKDPATMTRLAAVPEGARIKDVVTLDYNRDGHPDLAVLARYFDAKANSLADGYYLFAGDGTGRFTWVNFSGGFGDSTAIAAADMNRDGWDDLVITATSTSNFNQSTLSILLNSRTGYFATIRQTMLTGQVYAMTVGDVTGDAKLDVVLALNLENSITVEIGDGNGGFTNEAETSIAQVPSDIELVDFNRDGMMDYVVVDGFNLLALKGDGKGHYSDVQTYQLGYTTGGNQYASEVLVADLTDDGLPDLLTNYGLMLPGRDDGTFGPPEEFEFFWYSARAVDFDADGDLDIVTSDAYSLDVLLNQRTSVNHAPTADAGRDWTLSYAYQFDAEEFYLDGFGSADPDLHRLTYEWRENGKLIGYGKNPRPVRLLPGKHTYELTVYDGRGGSAKDTVVWTVTNFNEVVMHTDWGEAHGNWQFVEDNTAAGGYRMWNPDKGAAKLSAPLAAPANYVDLYFTPDPTLEYKLWIRGKADGNSWANDSVFVQFSDAVDAAGQPAYRIDTASALAVNLEECSGCGISGWGWEDDGWGAVDKAGVTLRFPNPQWQRIRIQTREDGFSIDQIVFSAVKYKTQRPGTAKNDATILARTQW